MLDDTSATVLDIIDNTDHIRLYYPTDDALHTNGSFTLVPHKYITHLPRMLKVTNSSIACCLECYSSGIPDKLDIVNVMKCTLDGDSIDPIKSICNACR